MYHCNADRASTCPKSLGRGPAGSRLPGGAARLEGGIGTTSGSLTIHCSLSSFGLENYVVFPALPLPALEVHVYWKNPLSAPHALRDEQKSPTDNYFTKQNTRKQKAAFHRLPSAVRFFALFLDSTAGCAAVQTLTNYIVQSCAEASA